jgi:hypothetical protein
VPAKRYSGTAVHLDKHLDTDNNPNTIHPNVDYHLERENCSDTASGGTDSDYDYDNTHIVEDSEDNNDHWGRKEDDKQMNPIVPRLSVSEIPPITPSPDNKRDSKVRIFSESEDESSIENFKNTSKITNSSPKNEKNENSWAQTSSKKRNLENNPHIGTPHNGTGTRGTHNGTPGIDTAVNLHGSYNDDMENKSYNKGHSSSSYKDTHTPKIVIKIEGMNNSQSNLSINTYVDDVTDSDYDNPHNGHHGNQNCNLNSRPNQNTPLSNNNFTNTKDHLNSTNNRKNSTNNQTNMPNNGIDQNNHNNILSDIDDRDLNDSIRSNRKMNSYVSLLVHLMDICIMHKNIHLRMLIRLPIC